MGTIEIEVDKNLDLTVYTLKVGVSYEELSNAITQYYTQGKMTKYILLHFTKDSSAKLTREQVGLLGKQMGIASKVRTGGYDLIVVSNILGYGLAHIYNTCVGMVKKDSEGPKTLIFRTKENALNWIEEMNAIKSSGKTGNT